MGLIIYTITDSDTCSISDSIIVHEPMALTTTITGTDAQCFGELTGTATVTPSGGTAPYFYVWSANTQANPTIFGLGKGTHYVTVTDAYNCTAFDTITIGEPMPLQISTTHIPVSCYQGSDGIAQTSVTGGIGNYTYQWSVPSTDTFALNLSAGFYFVDVLDSNNCSISDTVEVTEPPVLTLETDTIPTSCFGYSDGGASVMPSGGNGDYTYQWSSSMADTLSSVSDLPAGSYSVTVTDLNGCTDSATVFIDQPTPITTTTSFTPTSCFGDSDGMATVIATGGTIANRYHYTWSSTAADSLTAINLLANWHYVTVTDDHNCFAIDSIEVEQPDLLSANLSQQPASCHNGTDGQASVLATGGNGGYLYNWSTFDTTDTIYGLNAGQAYFITVTDAKNCTTLDTITIGNPDLLTATTTVTHVACHDSMNGTVTALVSGGTAPFQYQWDANTNNQTTQTATNLGPNIYTVNITDNNGCVTTANAAVSEQPPLAMSFALTSVLCYGDTTGAAEVTALGGTPNYTYQWQTNMGIQTAALATNLVAGDHTITLTDSQGCELVETITILQPDAPLATTLTVDDISCFGGFNGQIDVDAMGGTAPYLYSLDNTNYTTSSVFIGLQTGTYDIYTKDDHGCLTQNTATITEPAPIEVNLGADITIDVADSTVLSPTISNGFAPFTYTWTPPDTFLSCTNCPTPTVSGLPFDKEYTLVVTDDNGCTSSDRIFVRIIKTRNVFVANAFTPNGDFNNDVLFVQGDAQVVSLKTFRVYDRWGELVHEVIDGKPNDQTLGWDGTFKGKPMNTGTFSWYVEVEFADGESKVYKGSVLLIR